MGDLVIYALLCFLMGAAALSLIKMTIYHYRERKWKRDLLNEHKRVKTD